VEDQPTSVTNDNAIADDFEGDRHMGGFYAGTFNAGEPSSRVHYVIIPYWCLLCLTALLSASRLLSPCLRRSRVRVGLCHSCGYNLTGNISGVCPECGVVIAAKAVA